MAELTAPLTGFATRTSEVGSTAAHRVGTRGHDADGNEYRYVKFTEANGPGGWATFDGSWNATRVTTTTRGPLGVAQTTSAANDYGWVKVYGIEDVAQISTGDSAATSTYVLTAPSGATSEPTLTAAAPTSAIVNNAVLGAWIKAAASTATTGSSSSHSGTTVQVYLNYPFLLGFSLESTS